MYRFDYSFYVIVLASRGSGEDLVLGGVDNVLDWAGVAGAIGSSTDFPAIGESYQSLLRALDASF